MKIVPQPQTSLYKSSNQTPIPTKAKASSQNLPSESVELSSTNSPSSKKAKPGKSLGGALLTTAIGAGQGYLTSVFSDGSTWGAAKLQGGIKSAIGATEGMILMGDLGHEATGKFSPSYFALGGCMGAIVGGVAGLASGTVLGAVSNHLIPAENKMVAFAIGGGALNLAGYLLK